MSKIKTKTIGIGLLCAVFMVGCGVQDYNISGGWTYECKARDFPSDIYEDWLCNAVDSNNKVNVVGLGDYQKDALEDMMKEIEKFERRYESPISGQINPHLLEAVNPTESENKN